MTDLSLAQWLTKIEGMHPQNMCFGLDRVSSVGAKANVLAFSFPVVTVAGTNGKGSTVASLSALLQAAGLNVGTYTSPHLFDFKERVQINGQTLDDQMWCDAFEKIDSFRSDTLLTFFEFTTLGAFEIFQRQQSKLDIVILEIGLGGRLDAVNVIEPSLSIVTTLGLDHQEYLGTSLESIAKEKAGIFRTHQQAVIGRSACVGTLLAQAAALNVSLCIEGEHFDYDAEHNIWRFGDKTNIKVEHFLPNCSVSLAMAAYTILGKHYFSLPHLSKVVNSLGHKVMVGRCYPVVINKRPVIFDVGHNPQGSEWLATTIKKMVPKAKISAVWASMADKDLIGIVQPLKDIVSDWYVGFITDNLRCAKIEELENALKACEVKGFHSFENIEEAFDKALNADNEIVLVFGSFYTVSHVMQHAVPNLNMNNSGLSGISTILAHACLNSEC